MNSQLSLFAQDSPSASVFSSVFVAFIPSEIAVRSISGYREWVVSQYGPLGKIVRPDLYHMTLAYIGSYQGDIPPRVLREAAEACGAAAKVSPFPIELDRLGVFTKKAGHTLVMNMGNDSNPELLAFQQSLMEQLWRRGLRCKENPKFNPHVTLSREAPKISEAIAPVGWIAGEVVLLKSLIGQSRYEALGSWTLGED